MQTAAQAATTTDGAVLLLQQQPLGIVYTTTKVVGLASLQFLVVCSDTASRRFGLFHHQLWITKQ